MFCYIQYASKRPGFLEDVSKEKKFTYFSSHCIVDPLGAYLFQLFCRYHSVLLKRNKAWNGVSDLKDITATEICPPLLVLLCPTLILALICPHYPQSPTDGQSMWHCQYVPVWLNSAPQIIREAVAMMDHVDLRIHQPTVKMGLGHLMQILSWASLRDHV